MRGRASAHCRGLLCSDSCNTRSRFAAQRDRAALEQSWSVFASSGVRDHALRAASSGLTAIGRTRLLRREAFPQHTRRWSFDARSPTSAENRRRLVRREGAEERLVNAPLGASVASQTRGRHAARSCIERFEQSSGYAGVARARALEHWPVGRSHQHAYPSSIARHSAQPSVGRNAASASARRHRVHVARGIVFCGGGSRTTAGAASVRGTVGASGRGASGRPSPRCGRSRCPGACACASERSRRAAG